MNDNATLPVPPTTIPPQEEIKENEVYKQIEALIELWKGNILDSDILKSINPETLLITIAACLNMAMPPSPLYARGVGISVMTFPDGKIFPAIAMELFPGKQVLMPILSREFAENFEKLLRKAIDGKFGRIIQP